MMVHLPVLTYIHITHTSDVHDDPLPYIGAPSRVPTTYEHPLIHAHSPDRPDQHYWLQLLPSIRIEVEKLWEVQ